MKSLISFWQVRWLEILNHVTRSSEESLASHTLFRSENADHESSAIQVRLNLALNQLTEQNLAKGGRKSPVFWTTEPITQEPEVRFWWNFAWWVAFWCTFRKCWVFGHPTSMEAVLEYHPFSWKKVYETYLCTKTTHCVKLEPQKMQWPLSNG